MPLVMIGEGGSEVKPSDRPRIYAPEHTAEHKNRVRWSDLKYA